MNKFLQYINEVLVSLDIPMLADTEKNMNYRMLKKYSSKSKPSQQK
ncbi:hypothetical protein JAO71_10435 [Olleya sp. YSTF-M6]|uniref:Uncharacterized protein n=1 Tax=Olleya sediminilitoris TaxID=2795739 RepID=A0ABS1WM69_9FLAO|nr:MULTISPECIES: hypothetical protein [Olleya]MBL7560217.1 hypothetical protein [Olleya sediminilitoris]